MSTVHFMREVQHSTMLGERATLDTLRQLSVISIPELRSRPDGLAWGKIDQTETLFWLEVETTKSRGRVEQTIALRRAKAKGFAVA